MSRSFPFLFTGALLLLAGCTTTVQTAPISVRTQATAADGTGPHDALLATAWMQTAAEYRALSYQAYAAAARSLEEALADPTWTAAPEQLGTAFAELPPALIVDVDETVLDNVPYQAQLIADGETFTEANWADWVERAEAEPVPGALSFLQAAAAGGITVFYVTNRVAEAEAATARNLRAWGFPLAEDRDVLFMRGENGWPSDKRSRRLQVAAEFRILLLCGDDLNDFVSGVRTPRPEPRTEVAEAHADWFGSRWIVLPNPVYGSWEASLFGRDYSRSPTERRERIRRALEGYGNEE